MAIERIMPDGMPHVSRSLLRGYSMVVKAGNTVYTAGQVSNGTNNKIVGPGDIEAQVRQTWHNIEEGMKAAGGSLKDIVRVVNFVTDIHAITSWYQVWNELFTPENRPVSTFVEIPRLAHPGMLIEIEAIGVLGGGIERIVPDTMPQLPKPRGFSMVTKAGNTVYVAGQTGIDRDARVAGDGSIEAQIRQTWHNISEGMKAAGGSLKDLVKVTTYVTDIGAIRPWFDIWNELYRPEERPASTFVEVSRLARPGLMVEIDAIGVLGGDVQRINPDTMPSGRSYSMVVKAGNTVYTAGQVGFDRNGNLVGPGDIQAQMDQTFQNLVEGMKAVGGSAQSIVKVTDYVTDIISLPSFYSSWNEIYAPEERPASTFIEVPRLALPGAWVEIEAIGVLD